MKRCLQCNKVLSNRFDKCTTCGGELKIITDIEDVDLKACVIEPHKHIPKCPTCQSTNITKIGTGNKVASAVTLGVFSLGHISKTFKCGNCGYKW